MIPANLTLIGPFPNPAGYESNIVYYLSRFADITIRVFSVSGELVRQVKLKGQTGYNNWNWDLKNNSEKKVASGIYIIHIIMDDSIYKRKEDAWCKASVVK
ncbi:MAG: T9SS type A sorting domain-containing protein [Candidatus Goldbacteria bacterium]|nr:T9SS type A sorting domain-containing protein [Candidatus Goldiibacteriota bacterium]